MNPITVKSSVSKPTAELNGVYESRFKKIAKRFPNGDYEYHVLKGDAYIPTYRMTLKAGRIVKFLTSEVVNGAVVKYYESRTFGPYDVNALLKMTVEYTLTDSRCSLDSDMTEDTVYVLTPVKLEKPPMMFQRLLVNITGMDSGL
jgi:hypothetical protein